MSLPLADELLLHLATSDRRAAEEHCGALVRAGLTLERVVDDGLAPAMDQVGALWEAGVWSVVDEHLATAAAEAALSAAALEGPAPRDRGPVVVGCVEGDWHSLPSRMVAEVLASHGWSVRFLGASSPTDLLVDHLTRQRPQAVVLTCSVVTALPAAMAAVDAVHGLDLPVYVGGRAFGGDPRRAEAIGADGWARDAAGAAELLRSGRSRPRGARDSTARLEACRARRLLMPAWVVDAADELHQGRPPASAGVPDRTGPDLHHLLDTAGVGLLLDDPAVLDEQCAWLVRVLAGHGHPPDAVPDALAALGRTRPPGGHADDLVAALRRVQSDFLAG